MLRELLVIYVLMLASEASEAVKDIFSFPICMIDSASENSIRHSAMPGGSQALALSPGPKW